LEKTPTHRYTTITNDLRQSIMAFSFTTYKPSTILHLLTIFRSDHQIMRNTTATVIISKIDAGWPVTTLQTMWNSLTVHFIPLRHSAC